MLLRSSRVVSLDVLPVQCLQSGLLRLKTHGALTFSSFAMRQNQKSIGLALREEVPVPRTSKTLEVELHVPDNKIYTSKIKRLGDEGKFKEARKIFDSIEVKNTIVYSAMLACAARCGQYSEGLELFHEMKTEGLPLTEPVYVSAMNLYGGCSQSSVGLALFKEIRDQGLARNAPPYTVAINLCSNLGQYDEARDIWVDMLDRRIRPTASAFTSLMNAAASAGNLHEVESHFTELSSWGLRPSRGHFGCILKACRSTGDPERAEQVLTDMRLGPVKPDVLHYTIAMSIYRVTGLSLKEPAAAHHRIAKLAAHMSEEGIRKDKFFLEEHVAAIFGGELQHFMTDAVTPGAEAIRIAIQVLQEAEAEGMKKTRLLSEVQRKLSNMARHRPGNSDSSLWLEATDPATGRRYFYHSLTREVSWNRPCG